MVTTLLFFEQLTQMGQDGHTGRHPINLHMNGDMSESYIRHCALHQTYNRAINIQGTHNVRVEHNVLYDIQVYITLHQTTGICGRVIVLGYDSRFFSMYMY